MASNTESPGLKQVTFRSSNHTAYLNPNEIANGTDFDDIYIGADEKGRPMLYLSVNESAAKRIAAATSNGNAELMAITIGGIPEIALPVTESFSRKFVISGTFSKPEIAQLYTAITGYEKE